MSVDLQISAAQIKGQKSADGQDEHCTGEVSETYPVSEPSGTDLTNVGLRAFSTSLTGSDDEHIHHCHGVTIVSESLCRLA